MKIIVDSPISVSFKWSLCVYSTHMISLQAPEHLMVKLCCCLVQIRWWYNMTSFICYKSHHTSHFSNLWVFPITHSDQIKPCIEHAGFLSSYILTNSIFQYTHYGMWTFKWMQQFHLKVTSRYYNGTLSLFYLDVCFLQINTLFFFFYCSQNSNKRTFIVCVWCICRREKYASSA